MRRAAIVVLLVTARLAAGGCLDDCRDDWGGSGPDYDECVADCGVCGNGDLEGDEECDDGNRVGGDCCDAACRPEPAGSPCRDAEDPTDEELCTTPVCDGDGGCEREETPAPECRWPVEEGASTLRLRDADDDAKDRLVWTWRRGGTTGRADFGDPTGTTAYALCLYDDSGIVASLVLPAGAGWIAPSGGFRYRSPAGEPGGATSARLRQGGRVGPARIRVEAAGEDFDVPDLAALGSPLTVQLRRSGGASCWAARYTFPAGRRHARRRFRDRSDAPPVPTTTTSTAPPFATSTTTTAPAPGATTTTTAVVAAATVEVTVLDPAGAPVAGADVIVTYGGVDREVSDFTDDAGVVVFAGEPAGVPATITAGDDGGRTGAASSPGFAAGGNRVTVTVR
jgi:cysteine-rich repeat protein